MIPKSIVPIHIQIPVCLYALGIVPNEAGYFLSCLRENGLFIHWLNVIAAREPSFGTARFTDSSDFKAWREALYVCIRTIRPMVVVETGVHHGFSSSFILQGLHDNGYGKLFSVDLDPDSDGYSLEPSLRAIPNGRKPGWIIPMALRDKWDLRLMPSRKFFAGWEKEPTGIDRHGIDIFIHDSDHSPDNVRAEIQWAWPRINEGGLLVVDNTERSSEAVRDLLRMMPGKTKWTDFTIENVAAPDDARWETMFIRKWRG